jgi:hypothetical protein
MVGMANTAFSIRVKSRALPECLKPFMHPRAK